MSYVVGEKVRVLRRGRWVKDTVAADSAYPHTFCVIRTRRTKKLSAVRCTEVQPGW